MAEQTDLRKLLVLRGPTLDGLGALSFLQKHFQVEVFDELPEALEAMRQSRFDAVLAETADFLPLDRGVVTQQAAVVLDTIGDGVCIVGPSGELVWANRRLREFPPEVIDPLRSICVRAYEELASAKRPDSNRGRRFSMMPPNGRYYEVICSPVRDFDGLLRQVVAVVVDATTQRRQQLKLNAIDRAGRELVNLQSDPQAQGNALDRLRLLEERIMRCSKDVLEYKHFALLLLDASTNRLEPIVSEGLDRYGGQYELFASAENNGICGYVAATGRSYICIDVRKDLRYLPGLHVAKSSLTVPLRMNEKVVGVLNVESVVQGAFSEEDRQFAEMFANHVALALHILNLLVNERFTAHSQMSGSVSVELAGPVNDIITEANELLEDYIGHDDLRKRLQGIIDSACEARTYIHDLSESPAAGVSCNGTQGVVDPALAGKRVLVADDEKLIRQTIRDVLTVAGCEVDTAEDGVSAVTMLGRAGYDLVISDIKMPGATGYEVFAAAKEHCPNAGVVLMTAFGYDPHHSIVQANRDGLSAVLMKPFKVKKLLEECRAAITPTQ